VAPPFFQGALRACERRHRADRNVGLGVAEAWIYCDMAQHILRERTPYAIDSRWVSHQTGCHTAPVCYTDDQKDTICDRCSLSSLVGTGLADATGSNGMQRSPYHAVCHVPCVPRVQGEQGFVVGSMGETRFRHCSLSVGSLPALRLRRPVAIQRPTTHQDTVTLLRQRCTRL